ncbi:MAG TPA: cytochrome c oxidase subunit 3 [Thermodesulfobacteriota bacterium]|nr:cytochrome c oxidase subunit 3 [Thermodesulfobacteriota bacterium]
MKGGAGHAQRDYAGAKLGMWLFLLTEAMFFFGPVLLYAVFRMRFPSEFSAASRELDLATGALNTVVLITSSLLVASAVSAMKRGSRNLAAALLIATVALGAFFIFNKYVEWDAKILHGIYPDSATLLAEPYGKVVFYGLYFFLTGLHGLHVLAGMGALSVTTVMVYRGAITPDDHVRLENTGLYWHLVDIIWIFLFPFFYLVT